MKRTHLLCSLLLVSTLGACSKATEEKQEVVTPEATTQTEITPITRQSTQKYVANPDWETLNVGSEVSYEPFEFLDESGLPTGFEVELLQEIAKVERFNINIFNHPRKDIVNSFKQGNFAIWASALSNNPKRAKLMDLSDPIITTELSVFVLDNAKNQNIITAKDLQGKSFAVSKGASSKTLDNIEHLSGSKDDIVFANSFFLAMTNVYKGKATAILADKRVAQYYMQSFPEYKLKAIALDKGEISISFAVKKGDKKTLEKINNGLKTVKKNGTYSKLFQKWFGSVS